MSISCHIFNWNKMPRHPPSHLPVLHPQPLTSPSMAWPSPSHAAPPGVWVPGAGRAVITMIESFLTEPSGVGDRACASYKGSHVALEGTGTTLKIWGCIPEKTLRTFWKRPKHSRMSLWPLNCKCCNQLNSLTIVTLGSPHPCDQLNGVSASLAFRILLPALVWVPITHHCSKH